MKLAENIERRRDKPTTQRVETDRRTSPVLQCKRKSGWSLTLFWMPKLKEPFKKKVKHCIEHFVYTMARQIVSNNSKKLFTFQDQGGNTKFKIILKSKLATF